MTGREDVETRCEWCALPKVPDEDQDQCLCDRPAYTEMAQCVDCGLWVDVDHLRVPEDRDGEPYVCALPCPAQFGTDGGSAP